MTTMATASGTVKRCCPPARTNTCSWWTASGGCPIPWRVATSMRYSARASRTRWSSCARRALNHELAAGPRAGAHRAASSAPRTEPSPQRHQTCGSCAGCRASGDRLAHRRGCRGKPADRTARPESARRQRQEHSGRPPGEWRAAGLARGLPGPVVERLITVAPDEPPGPALHAAADLVAHRFDPDSAADLLVEAHNKGLRGVRLLDVAVAADHELQRQI